MRREHVTWERWLQILRHVRKERGLLYAIWFYFKVDLREGDYIYVITDPETKEEI